MGTKSSVSPLLRTENLLSYSLTKANKARTAIQNMTLLFSVTAAFEQQEGRAYVPGKSPVAQPYQMASSATAGSVKEIKGATIALYAWLVLLRGSVDCRDCSYKAIVRGIVNAILFSQLPVKNENCHYLSFIG